jgi:hypothetical protein
MSGHDTIRRIGRRIPGPLRELRAKLLLDFYAARLGVVEVACPACKGSGRPQWPSAEVCPICRGFEEVPQSLAAWFAEEMATEVRPEGRGDAGRLTATSSPADGVRFGRSAELAFAVCMDEVRGGMAAVALEREE